MLTTLVILLSLVICVVLLISPAPEDKWLCENLSFFLKLIGETEKSENMIWMYPKDFQKSEGK